MRRIRLSLPRPEGWRRLFQASVTGAALPVLLLPVGCGTGGISGSGTPPPPVVYTGLTFTGTVKAGSAALAGASVQLYAAGSTGNGSTPTTLLSSAVTSSATGAFTIPAAYNCPSSSSLVYLLSQGGAIGSGSNNPNAVLMAAVGTCGSITTSTAVVIDEVTTVAAIYALAPFYAKTGGIGASSTNSTGLANAFASAATLANTASGTAPGASLPANAVSPAPRINSVANLLNTCVVSANACSGLYSAVGGNASNTLDALYALARNPGGNTATLYNLAAADSAYGPALTAQPADFTMFLTLSAPGVCTTTATTGMCAPTGLGVDGTGSVWVVSYFGSAWKFTPSGALAIANGVTGAGLNNSYGLSIDSSNNVWIPNEQPGTSNGTGTVTELSSTGNSLAGSGYINGGMNFPIATAIDPNGTVWVVQYGNSHVSLLNSSGSPISGASGYVAPTFAFPISVAIDGNHFGWIGDQNDSNVTRVAPDGSSFQAYSCCDGPAGIAVDQGNNIWIANFYGDSVSLISSAGAIVSNGAYTGNGSIDHPQGIAIDGSGSVWLANYRQPYLTELAGTSSTAPGALLTPVKGLGADAQLLEAYALAIDASGNIWVSNQGSNTITKFFGLATPVKTPMTGLPVAP